MLELKFISKLEVNGYKMLTGVLNMERGIVGNSAAFVLHTTQYRSEKWNNFQQWSVSMRFHIHTRLLLMPFEGSLWKIMASPILASQYFNLMFSLQPFLLLIVIEAHRLYFWFLLSLTEGDFLQTNCEMEFPSEIRCQCCWLSLLCLPVEDSFHLLLRWLIEEEHVPVLPSMMIGDHWGILIPFASTVNGLSSDTILPVKTFNFVPHVLDGVVLHPFQSPATKFLKGYLCL